MCNVKLGFRATGIWPLNEELVLEKHAIDLDSEGGAAAGISVEDDPQACIHRSFMHPLKKFLNAFHQKIGVLDSYGLIPGTSIVTKKSKAAMTSSNFLEALRLQDVTTDVILLTPFTHCSLHQLHPTINRDLQ